MALSNWSSIAISSEEDPAFAEINFDGVGVSVRKDTVEIHDPESWTKKHGFCEPIVIVLRDAILRYKGIQLVVKRGPRDGVYLAVWDDVNNKTNPKWMLACAAYIYQDEEKILITEDMVSFLADMASTIYNYKMDCVPDHSCPPDAFENVKFNTENGYNQGYLRLNR